MADLEYYGACWCAGSGCGGHVKFMRLDIDSYHFTPIGWQGATQHTYTPSCAGIHAPGSCPEVPLADSPQ